MRVNGPPFHEEHKNNHRNHDEYGLEPARLFDAKTINHDQDDPHPRGKVLQQTDGKRGNKGQGGAQAHQGKGGFEHKRKPGADSREGTDHGSERPVDEDVIPARLGKCRCHFRFAQGRWHE